MLSNAAVQSKNEQSRGPLLRQEYPTIDLFSINAGLGSPEGTLTIIAGGKYHSFTINRRDIFGFASEAFKTLQKMEPGK